VQHAALVNQMTGEVSYSWGQSRIVRTLDRRCFVQNL